MFVYYGVYFGVLGRDMSEICTDKMAANIGVSSIIKSSHYIHCNESQQLIFLSIPTTVLHTSWYAIAELGPKCVCGVR